MRKTSYLKTTRQIAKKVSNKFESPYTRFRSEPRKSTGYATKIYACEHAENVARFINYHFSEKVHAEAVTTQLGAWRVDDVKIVPVKKVRKH